MIKPFYTKQTSLLRLKKTDRTVGTDQLIAIHLSHRCSPASCQTKEDKTLATLTRVAATPTRVRWNDQAFENTIADARTMVACSVSCSRYKQPVGNMGFRPKSQLGSLCEKINKNCCRSLDTHAVQKPVPLRVHFVDFSFFWCGACFSYFFGYKGVCDWPSSICAFQIALILNSSILTQHR